MSALLTALQALFSNARVEGGNLIIKDIMSH